MASSGEQLMKGDIVSCATEMKKIVNNKELRCADNC